MAQHVSGSELVLMKIIWKNGGQLYTPSLWRKREKFNINITAAGYSFSRRIKRDRKLLEKRK